MRSRRAQKAALTWAINTGDHDQVKTECRRVLADWEVAGAWPDDWSRWDRALMDSTVWPNQIGLDDLLAGMNETI